MSHPRKYKLGAAFKRDPHAYEALQPESRRAPFDLDEELPWPLPGQPKPSADQPMQEPKQ